MHGDRRELERLGGTSESVPKLLGVDAQRTVVIFAENVNLLDSSPPATNNNPMLIIINIGKLKDIIDCRK